MGIKPVGGVYFPGMGGAPDMTTKTITTAELFGTLREIIILHDGKEYRLRITSNGKLILTK